MSFNPCPSFYSRLSCTPPSCNPYNLYNPYSGCSLLPPPSFSPTCSCSSPQESCGKLAKFVNGNGDNPCQTSYRSPPRECVPSYRSPAREYVPLKPRFRSKNNIPPAFIESGTERRAGGRTPAERLRNVDMLEELCYYVPGGSGGESSNGEESSHCFYAICNCCGAPEYIPCECPGRECYKSQNPVKYSRRQRFTFEENEVKMNNFEGVGTPCWPFDQYQTQTQQTPFSNPPAAFPNYGVETNLGRPQQSRIIPSVPSVDNVLPRTTGVYYFDSTRRIFIPQEVLPKPPEVIYQKQPCCLPARPQVDRNNNPQRPAAPAIQEFEIFEEEKAAKEPEVVVQPIIQPVLMPNSSNPGTDNCNPCNNPWTSPCNPCYPGGNPTVNGNNSCSPYNSCYPPPACNPCNPMSCNQCFNSFMPNTCNPSIMPMCIPMCAPPAPPPPTFPGMFPGMFPGGFPGMAGMYPPSMMPKDKKKKKKKKEKKHKSSYGSGSRKYSKEEETIIDFVDDDQSLPPFSPPQSSPPISRNSPSPHIHSSQSNKSPPGGVSITVSPGHGESPHGSHHSSPPHPHAPSPPRPLGSSPPAPSSPHPPGSSPPHMPASDNYSTNIVVAGGPAQLVQRIGPPPPGAYMESINSQMSLKLEQEQNVLVPQQSTQMVNLQPAAVVEESNVDVGGGSMYPGYR